MSLFDQFENADVAEPPAVTAAAFAPISTTALATATATRSQPSKSPAPVLVSEELRASACAFYAEYKVSISFPPENSIPQLEQGYVSTAVPTNRLPVFCMDKVQFPFPIPKIRAVAVSSNFLAVAVEGSQMGKDGSRQQRILRIDLGKVDAIEGGCLTPC